MKNQTDPNSGNTKKDSMSDESVNPPISQAEDSSATNEEYNHIHYEENMAFLHEYCGGGQ